MYTPEPKKPTNKVEDKTPKKDVKDSIDSNAKDCDILFVYRPLNILNKLGGIQKITFTENDTTTVGFVVKIYSLILSGLIFTNTFFIIRDVYDRKIVAIVKVIDILSKLCVCVSAIISSLLAAFLISPFMLRALKSFRAVDEKLAIHGKNKYTYLRSRIMIGQAIVVVVAIAHFIFEEIAHVKIWSVDYRNITMHLTDFFVHCQLLDFTAVVWLIVTRMKVFNSQLEDLIVDEREKEKLQGVEEITFSNKITFDNIGGTQLRNRLHGQQKLDPKTRTDTLIRLMKVFDELADITNIVSSSYGLSILFSSTLTFLYIISTVNGLIMFKILLDEDSNHTIPYILCWCLPDTVYLLVSAYCTEKLKNEVERTNASIDKLSINSQHDTKESELIEDFSQLLSVREVFITAANFFPYDMTFILSLVGAVATYTVLLMQVKTDKSSGGTNSTLINATLSNITLLNTTLTNTTEL